MAGPLGRSSWTKRSRSETGRLTAPRDARMLVAILFGFASAGCVGIKAHDARLRNTALDLGERIDANRGVHLSLESGAVLARQQLLTLAKDDAVGAARLLETRLQTQSEPNGALALAELSYHLGLVFQSGSPAEAMARYRDAATLAALALTDAAAARTDLAVDLHNRSIARLIRLAQTKNARQSDSPNWRKILEAEGIAVRSSTAYLEPDRIGDLRVASDYRVEGMGHIYRTNGLGIPLVAHRWTQGNDPKDVQEQFFPREMRIAATAIITPGGGLLAGEWRKKPPTLQLLDPFAQSIDGRRLVEPRARDRHNNAAGDAGVRANLEALEWTGFFDSDFGRLGIDTGLYMLRPYEPGKIPVVFVHGLVSSPRAWVQVINDLQNTPDIAAHYQFWLFIYPHRPAHPWVCRATARIIDAVRAHARSQRYRRGVRQDSDRWPQHGWCSCQDDGPGLSARAVEFHNYRARATNSRRLPS